MKADLATFFNIEELADRHTVDGVEMDAVVDENLAQERQRQLMEVDGVYMDRVVLFVREGDLGYRPVAEQWMKIDGAGYMVKGCSADAGVLMITLEANRA